MRKNDLGLSFHHFGLAVREPEEAVRFLEALGYEIASSIPDPLQRVNLAFCSHPTMPDVELVWPGEEPSPIDAIVKRNNGLVYHLCYTADDPDEAVAAIEASGLNIVAAGPAKAAVLFGGREVAFFYVENFGLIEIIRGNPTEFAAESVTHALS
jgi:catechol 2,3-dioxygenase-like lactoylglutathione lyase family enzyme